jgi:uncharacterized protein (DUF2126 family)/transglutaminase-like putative cysteine protease
MPIHVALRHQTRYTYDRPVGHGPHVIRLRPAPHCRTNILSFSQKITGGEHFINWQQDAFANWNARLVFPGKLTEFNIEVEVVAEMAVYNPFDFFIEEEAKSFPFTYEPTLRKDLTSFLEPGPLTPRFAAYLQRIRREILGHPDEVPHAATPATGHLTDVHHDGGQLPHLPDTANAKATTVPAGKEPLRTIDLLVALNQRLQRDLKYVIRLEPGVQSPEETLTRNSGSCRDSGWLLVETLRHLGLAARFASGYLIQLAPDLKSLDGPSGTEVDFTDLHAWCEVYLPGAGWIGLDPTSGLLAGEGHIPLSCTPEPSSAAPVSGAIDECKSTLHHKMGVTRIYESPRVTKPYTEDQWTRMDALGQAIDADLSRLDVRLTMGGEPTFVSVDDPDGPEWNFTAVSPKKRVLSGTLIKRLRDQFAPGSLLHYGQGKWYPGEPLPRWALGAYWRKDGVPIWRNASLIADESRDYGHSAIEARELLQRLARTLEVDPRHMLPGYEDIFYYTWKERRLPANVTPERSNLKDKQERDRLARLFQKGLGEVAGYVLPIKRSRSGTGRGWVSGSWFLRDDKILWLLPGDSPMGLRLPLDSIPWVEEKEYPWNWEPDPIQKFPPLPVDFAYGNPSEISRQHFIRSPIPPSRPGSGPGERAQVLDETDGQGSAFTPDPDPNRRPAPNQSAPWIIRTGLCVEPREGRLHVFLPPVARTEDYLDLIAALEATVTEMGVPIIIEGELPPRDPRLQRMAVTPDPGVIEVNLPPSASWGELVKRTEVLYEEARQTRLGTEKFMLDGRHTGTGGGNHILLGGDTPADSPILRRPDLLRSLLAYWQNHPSLSWLFSGLFIGPTSQAPRVDEARHDSLYELEISFQELDRQIGLGEGKALPWLVDRLFRNLLIDASGNTHRSEFSIDKLYAPESSSGRLGLVEMRAFEMPPHARMSLAQHLLLRGLVARFWREPYRNPLIRWGTDLHDRWMLPHFCETDFRDVLRELRESGYAFEPEWFAPHFEFRFPRIGDFAQRDVRIELRTALEPWHVLGDEPAGGGTVRYVDSSLERLQVKASGLIGERFAITVNGRRVPLHPTGINGVAVAGVRYRAWQPPNALQPTIGVHTPLTFDLHDTWNGRSLGGCTYHVSHPGGLSHSSFPVNAYEAESRRLARFQVHGHTQGSSVPVPPPRSREFPFTLDLRNSA